MIAGGELVAVVASIAAAAAAAATCPESALNCLTLYPTPDLPAIAGSIALLPASSPFGAAVDRDGRPVVRLAATISGLPAPSALGPFRAYVAWAYTLSLDSAVKLGEVRNGRVELGELHKVQFRVLITAERTAAVRGRGGRHVLRGTSPSARLLAHRDLLQPSAPGATRGHPCWRSSSTLPAARKRSSTRCRGEFHRAHQ